MYARGNMFLALIFIVLIGLLCWHGQKSLHELSVEISLDPDTARVSEELESKLVSLQIGPDDKYVTVTEFVNATYLRAAINTFLITACIAFAMPILSFSISSLQNFFLVRGNSQIARLLELMIDLIPYILWTFIFAVIAMGIFGQENLLWLLPYRI